MNGRICGKVGYASRDVAISAKRALIGRRLTGRLSVYHCTLCEAFHLGRRPKDRPRPRPVYTAAWAGVDE